MFLIMPSTKMAQMLNKTAARALDKKYLLKTSPETMAQ